MSSPNKDKPYTLFEVISFKLHTGKTIPCARRGLTYIALGKIEIYGMGQVAKYPVDELQELQQLKQYKRKEFDKNPVNEERLQCLKALKHNYERSLEMYQSILQVGLVNSVEDTEKIIDHLLDVGEKVTIETGYRQISILEASQGKLKITSIWKILPDGRKYLSTIQFVPQGLKK